MDTIASLKNYPLIFRHREIYLYMMLLNLETKTTLGKKTGKQTKTPEYCKGKKKSHLILEGLEKSHLSYFMYMVLNDRQKNEKSQYLKTCVFAPLCANYSLNALKLLILLLYINLTYFFCQVMVLFLASENVPN